MMPSINEAENLLKWAAEENSGLWVEHSRTVARVASIIVKTCCMNGERCYVLGLLHDIGRYEGLSYLRHTKTG